MRVQPLLAAYACAQHLRVLLHPSLLLLLLLQQQLHWLLTCALQPLSCHPAAAAAAAGPLGASAGLGSPWEAATCPHLLLLLLLPLPLTCDKRQAYCAALLPSRQCTLLLLLLLACLPLMLLYCQHPCRYASVWLQQGWAWLHLLLLLQLQASRSPC
jgi:hypothetical protein